MTIEIDEVKALELLEAAVAERGADYTYQSEFGEGVICEYQYGGKPACLVGAALHKAGVDVDTLVQMDTGVFHTEEGLEYEVGGTSISDLAAEPLSWDEGTELPAPLSLFDITLTKKALDMFSVAQAAQDTGNTWGAALDEAKRAVA